ncbi:hypothetical protein ACWELO_25665 [Streptomyces sp. NPDC004596]
MTSNAVIPGLSAAGVESLKDAARAVDAARVNEAGAGREWALDQEVSPGPQPWTPVILGLDVIEYADGGGQMEFLLQVVWTDLGELEAEAAVNVACWCDTEHATHDFAVSSLVVGDVTSLPRAFRAGAERLIGWLVDPTGRLGHRDHTRNGKIISPVTDSYGAALSLDWPGRSHRPRGFETDRLAGIATASSPGTVIYRSTLRAQREAVPFHGVGRSAPSPQDTGSRGVHMTSVQNNDLDSNPMGDLEERRLIERPTERAA